MKKRVLILCTGNSCRSQMAEALLRQRVGEQVEVYSAGFEPRPIHPLTYRVMNEIGIDISGQRSKGFDELVSVGPILFLIIVCAKAEQGCPESFAPAAIRLVWAFDDPAAATGSEENRLNAFRTVRDQIRTRIDSWIREELPSEWFR